MAPPAPSLDDLLSRPTPLPSESTQSEQHFRTAIEASARTGSNLSELSKMLTELTSGVVGARRANEQLVEELSTLRVLLRSEGEQQLGLRRRIAELEQEVVTTRAAAERERHFLTSQHDDFIAALIEEHEEAIESQAGERLTTRMSAGVGDLAQKLAQAENLRAQAEAERELARESSRRLQVQRDEAQARAEQRERERDELRAEASQLRARLSTQQRAVTAPPPSTSPRPPSYRPPPALRLDASELDSTLHARPSQPRIATVPRLTPPPAELQQALARSERPLSASAFPRVGTNPGVGGPRPTEPPPSAPSFGPAPTGWTPPPPPPTAAELEASTVPPRPQRVISAASLPPVSTPAPALKQKPDPTTRPLISYSLGEDGVRAETLEGARISSKPPKK
jgi:hypothetical protein